VNKKFTILVTGDVDEGLIDDSNIDFVVIRFTSIKPIPAESMIKPLTQQENVVVFTSVNAVEQVTSYIDGQRPKWKIFCIGHATRNLAEQHFGANKIEGTANNASDLADEILDKKINAPVVFFCGKQRRDELPAKLKTAGLDVQEVEVYETIQTPKEIVAELDGIVFFSPSAVQSFFSINKVQPGTILFSIGSTTEAELRKYTGNKIITAGKPGKQEVLKNVIDYFKN
jgi:uroporphyrinogen-III synthase